MVWTSTFAASPSSDFGAQFRDLTRTVLDAAQAAGLLADWWRRATTLPAFHPSVFGAAMSDQPTVSILVVRHAEKPTWQRAGALAAWLGSVNRKMEIGLNCLATSSLRDRRMKAQCAIAPDALLLANALGLAVALEFAVGGGGTGPPGSSAGWLRHQGVGTRSHHGHRHPIARFECELAGVLARRPIQRRVSVPPTGRGLATRRSSRNCCLRATTQTRSSDRSFMKRTEAPAHPTAFHRGTALGDGSLYTADVRYPLFLGRGPLPQLMCIPPLRTGAPGKWPTSDSFVAGLIAQLTTRSDKLHRWALKTVVVAFLAAPAWELLMAISSFFVSSVERVEGTSVYNSGRRQAWEPSTI